MGWPLSQDYNEAVQSPGRNFADPDLCQGKAITNALGLPMPCSGNFADVYQIVCPDGSRWAVKCFTREVPGLRERYSAVGEYLAQAQLPFTVEFCYLEQGLRICGLWYPVLKMRWVEGLLLNEFVRGALDKPLALESLAKIIVRMGRRLREAQVAHGDLQHGNILLVLGGGTGASALKLVDYDGMYVPALEQNRPGEVGHAAYQHPQRLREGAYGPEVDRFPLLVIYCALRALLAGGRGLWDRYDNGDNLLFQQQDFEAPSKSALFYELLALGDPSVRSLAEKLIDAARKPVEQTPTLEEVMAGASPPLSRAAAPVAAVAPPPPERVAVPVPPRETTWYPQESVPPVRRAPREAPPWWARPEPGGGGVGAPAPPRIERQTPLRRPSRGVRIVAVAVAGGVGAMALALTLLLGLAPPVPPPPAPQNPATRPPPGPVGELCRFEGHRDTVWSVAFSPDGRYALSGGGDNYELGRLVPGSDYSVRLWDTQTGREVGRFTGHRGRVTSVAFAPGGTKALAGSADRTLRLWEVPSGREVRLFEGHRGPVAGVGFSGDSRYALSGGEDHTLRRWDVASGRESWRTGHTGPVIALAPGGRQALSWSDDEATGGARLRLWDVTAGNEVRTFGEGVDCLCLALSADGRYALSGGKDHTLRLWDVASGREVRQLKGHTNWVNSVAFSPDGRLALSGGLDETVRLWRVDGGQELYCFKGHTGPVRSVGFAPDGRRAVSGGDDKTVRVWGLPGAGTRPADPVPESPQEPPPGKKKPLEHGFLSRTYKAPGGTESRYMLFVPPDYDGRKPYPLILFLHGAGETGDDGHKQVEVGLGPAVRRRESTFPFIVVFPQARRKTWQADSPDAGLAMAILAEVQKGYNVDPRRVVLTGLSMGGSGAWGLAAEYPGRWAAIVPVCGAGEPAQAAKVKHIPCWCFHGGADPWVRVTRSRAMVNALKTAGGTPKYTEYKGVGHNCWDRAYGTPELYEWLLRQRSAGRQGLSVVGVWEHSVPAKRIKNRIEFMPDGTIKGALGGVRATWLQEGSTLTLTWGDHGSLGKGIWVDKCTVAPDGRSYTGRDLDNESVLGKRLEKGGNVDWVELFNGSNLRGWEVHLNDRRARAQDEFRVQEGVLRFGGQHHGYLVTAERYADFHLKLQYRFPEGGRVTPQGSGVVFRTGSDPPFVRPSHLEAQISPDDTGSFWVWQPRFSTRPDLVDRKFPGWRHRFTDAEKAAGKWNQYEIICKGDRVTLLLNGEVVNQGAGALTAASRVALLAQGTTIEFRSIRIRPNPEAGAGGEAEDKPTRPVDPVGEPPQDPALVKEKPVEHGFLSRTYKGPGGGERRYMLFVPQGYDGRTPYPLILFLHGAGEAGDDGHKQVEEGLGPAVRRRESTFPFIVVFPQARRKTWQPDSPDAGLAMAILAEVQKGYNVDPRRVVLTGLSMGGSGAWGLAAEYPDRWAAIVPLCCAGEPAQAAKIKHIPCWCFHGGADPWVPVTKSREMVNALRAAGGAPKYTEYRGAGHSCWDRVYGTPELYEWLLRQRAARPAKTARRIKEIRLYFPKAIHRHSVIYKGSQPFVQRGDGTLTPLERDGSHLKWKMISRFGGKSIVIDLDTMKLPGGEKVEIDYE